MSSTRPSLFSRSLSSRERHFQELTQLRAPARTSRAIDLLAHRHPFPGRRCIDQRAYRILSLSCLDAHVRYIFSRDKTDRILDEMWRRAYLILVLVRLWFALSPSYLHPDENFQGPEVIAGMYCLLPRLPCLAVALWERGASLGPPVTSSANSGARRNLQLPSPSHLGVYEREPHSKRVSAMARVWLTDAPPSLAMDRERTRRGDPSYRRLLGSSSPHVPHQLRP